MKVIRNKFGIVDKSFLSKSLGLLNPPAPLTVHQEDSVRDAVELLQKNRVGAVIIVNDEHKVAGVFTERDLCLKISLGQVDVDETTIGEVMTANPHTEEMATPVAFALNMMSQGGYRHIPIVDEDQVPVGIISVKDIVDYIVDEMTRDVSNTCATEIG